VSIKYGRVCCACKRTPFADNKVGDALAPRLAVSERITRTVVVLVRCFTVGDDAIAIAIVIDIVATTVHYRF